MQSFQRVVSILALLTASSDAFGPMSHSLFSTPSSSSAASLSHHYGSIQLPTAHSPSDPLTASTPKRSSSSSTTCLHVAGAQEAWTAYNEALVANPLLVKSVTAGIVLGAADLAGQALEASQKEDTGTATEVDFARTARFAFFGLVLQAPWNHFYYQLLDGAIPPTEEPWTATTGIKVVIDQFVQAPVFTVMIFAFLGFLEGKSVSAIKEQLDEDYTDTMLANWKLWVPATVVNIAFVPPILRVLYLNGVFFFWSIFLSLKLNKDSSSSTPSE